MPKASDRHFTSETLRNIADGEVLLRVLYLALDPAMRGWMNEGKSYIRPVAIDEVMRAVDIGKVVASKSPRLAMGDFVSGNLGVQQFGLGAADSKSTAPYKADPNLALLSK